MALSKNSVDPDIYYHRAQLHFIKGEFAEAQKDYQKSIDLDSAFIFSHIQLGGTLEILDGLGHLALLEEQLGHGGDGDVALGVD